MDTIVYEIGDNIYINLTNKCSNDCWFCERNRLQTVNGYMLWLSNEPTSEDIIKELKKRELTEYKEVVFCGFGEPTYSWEVIKPVADYAHSQGVKTRINTNGQGSLINGYDITTELPNYIDSVSISLNNGNAASYDLNCKSIYGTAAFTELQDFAFKCQTAGVDTSLSIVDCIGAVEIAQAKEIANRLGVRFKVRKEIK